MPAREIRFRDVTFAYRPDLPAVLDGFDLTIPAGTSMAIVGVERRGQDDAREAAVPALRPAAGSIEVDGVDLRELDPVAWRSRVTAVFQDFVRYERSLRTNVAPRGAPDEAIEAALRDAGACRPRRPRHDPRRRRTRAASTCRAASGSASRSPGRCARCERARAWCCSTSRPRSSTCAARPRSSPVLAATRHTTTILVSHRFSTVRQADRICVLEHGRVVELGTHDELMALGGRYQTMFDLQASRFTDEAELDEHGEEVVHDTLG